MTLIKSISGIRGTIGGASGDNLTPIEIVKFTSAYTYFIQSAYQKKNLKLVVGRDARISGEMVYSLVEGTLIAMGVEVINVGLSTTPTVEVMVTEYKADGGIILTASHNPKQWNALKLLNNKGEFLSAKEGEEILAIAESDKILYSDVSELGKATIVSNAIDRHIDMVLALPLVDVEAIKKANFRIGIDCVNSTGGISLVPLLEKLGVSYMEKLYCEPTGLFPHNPEPLPENLTEIAEVIVNKNLHLGFVVDPDVDRLAIVCEDGSMFGEEYTIVSIADYVLSKATAKPQTTVTNLSSTRALRDVTEHYKGTYFASAVGEVNVVEKMKEKGAIIGGEGNGGVIFPELHYGRDALVGIALFLSHLAHTNKTCSALRASYPNYFISKNKITLSPSIDVDTLLVAMAEKYKDYEVNTIDGVKIEIGNEWVHLRKSNTEPIIRIYAESDSMEKADLFAQRIMTDIHLIAHK